MKKYKLFLIYPQLDETGKVKYTYPKRYYFKYKLSAQIAKFLFNFIKLYRKYPNSYSVFIEKTYKYELETPLFANSGPEGMTYFVLSTAGDTLQELFNNATISETDHKGKELTFLEFEDIDEDGKEAAIEEIKKYYLKKFIGLE